MNIDLLNEDDKNKIIDELLVNVRKRKTPEQIEIQDLKDFVFLLIEEINRLNIKLKCESSKI